MPYVRRRGNQIAIVHGERERESGKVQQRVLFAFYSKDEAGEALGRRGKNGEHQFRSLLERQYPAIRFDWKKIKREIAKNLGGLPDDYPYRETRLRGRFRAELRTFLRQLVLTDPQDLTPSAEVIQEHRYELEYLADLIRWRLKTRQGLATDWNSDNRFLWRFELQGSNVPPEAEEFAVAYYEKGDLPRAEAAFRLLVECFDGYADGHNYLGVIAEERGDFDAAAAHFRRAVQAGRHLFPRRLGKGRYWNDLATRPYIRGLRNLANVLSHLGSHEEALRICDTLEKECDDILCAADQRTEIFLNLGRWQEAADASLRIVRIFPAAAFKASFALRELGRRQESLTYFLHGTTHFPRTARSLAGMPASKAQSSDEAEDHKTGQAPSQVLPGYLRNHPQARREFRRILELEQVIAILDESIHVVRRCVHQALTGHREARNRMNEMRTIEYAQERARELFPILYPAKKGSKN